MARPAVADSTLHWVSESGVCLHMLLTGNQHPLAGPQISPESITPIPRRVLGTHLRHCASSLLHVPGSRRHFCGLSRAERRFLRDGRSALAMSSRGR